LAENFVCQESEPKLTRSIWIKFEGGKGKMTVKDYVKAHPNTILARKLKSKFGADSRKQIWVGSGIVSGGRGYGHGAGRSGSNSPTSNIGRMMRQHGAYNYVVGGTAGKSATEGNTFAVFK
jgi:hypothetical protein